MPRRQAGSAQWRAFLVVAVAGALGIFLVSRLGLGTIQQTAVMAIIGILVVAAYEYFIGWG
jgi:uncharacterized membrane-anchored protein